MARPALAASRAVAILNFLAAYPGEGFTLSDLAGRLDINVASTHALLSVLSDAGYVIRHPRLRTFTLGPSIVGLGTAALEAHPAIDLARDAARDIARRTRLEVTLTAPAGDEIVFLARAGAHSPRGGPVHVGQRVPLLPPLGSVFVAWGEADGWLAASDDPATLRAILEGVRRRGYAVGLEASAQASFGHALDTLAGHPADDTLRGALRGYVTDIGSREYFAADLDEARSYDLSMIAAPIFGPTGDVVLALSILGFAGPVTGRDIIGWGEDLRDACLVVTKRSRGRVPVVPEH